MKNRIMEGLAERMKGGCCEVLKGPWNRLIREMGPDYAGNKRWPDVHGHLYVHVDSNGLLVLTPNVPAGHVLTSFDTFLARLLNMGDVPFMGPGSFAANVVEDDPFTAEQTLNIAAKAAAVHIGRDTSIHTVKAEDMLGANETLVPGPLKVMPNHRQPVYPINCGDVTYLGLSKKEHFCLAMGVPETGDPELDDIIRKGEMKRIVATK